MEDFRSSNGVVVRDFIEEVHRELKNNISQKTVYRTKVIAKKMIEGKNTKNHMGDFGTMLKNLEGMILGIT